MAMRQNRPLQRHHAHLAAPPRALVTKSAVGAAAPVQSPTMLSYPTPPVTRAVLDAALPGTRTFDRRAESCCQVRSTSLARPSCSVSRCSLLPRPIGTSRELPWPSETRLIFRVPSVFECWSTAQAPGAHQLLMRLWARLHCARWRLRGCGTTERPDRASDEAGSRRRAEVFAGCFEMVECGQVRLVQGKTWPGHGNSD